MHSVQGRGRATRDEVSPSEIFSRVASFFDARLNALSKAGVGKARLILDPGMGFFLGANPDASFEMLKRLPDLKALFGLPLLVSVSRKSFLRRLTGRDPRQAGAATLSAEIFAADQGADYIRTHDPAALKDAVKIWESLRNKA